MSSDDVAALLDAAADALHGQVLTREQLVHKLLTRTGSPHLEAQLRSGWGALLRPLAWMGYLCYGPSQRNRGLLLTQDADELAGTRPARAVRLLPAFDQYVLGPGTGDARIIRPSRRSQISKTAGWISPVVLVGGRIAGVWSFDGGTLAVGLFDEESQKASREPLEAEGRAHRPVPRPRAARVHRARVNARRSRHGANRLGARLVAGWNLP